MEQTALDHLDPAVAAMLGENYPQIPPINGLWEALPLESNPEAKGKARNQQRLMLQASNESGWAWIPDVIGEKRLGCPYVLRQFTQGGQADYTLTWRQYWRQVPNTYTHVPPGGGFTRTYRSMEGISQTDSQTISAELGVEAGILKAKLEATFSHSFTATEERGEETQYTVGSPEEGKVRVWVLWQLVDEIAALDPQGNVLNFGTQSGVVEVELPPSFGGGTASAECSLRYVDIQQRFPSQLLIPMQRDFAESSAPAGISMSPLGPMGFAQNPEGS